MVPESVEGLEVVASRIRQKRLSMKNLAEFLRKKEFLIKRVNPTSMNNTRILAVDGGLQKKSLQGVDLILVRACAVLYEFSEGKLVNVEYYPSEFPKPKLRWSFEPLSEFEFGWKTGYERQMEEISVAIEAFKRWDPDFVILDGSVIPHYSEIPETSKSLSEEFKKLVDSYNQLFKLVKRKTLFGVVKESRGKRFCSEVLEEVKDLPLELKPLVSNVRDTVILDVLLEKNERTMTFSYSSSPDFHPILRHFPEFSDKVYGFYIRNAEFDVPIRVDFISENPEEDADRISSLLINLTKNSFYAIPSILIEADQRARINEELLDSVQGFISSLVGDISDNKRKRPF
ncbi:MAG: DNA double-strand break repair nuclease NurA [Candidatus Aenigmarchaeota archaeon]|nr:DNA double-strand break repair nuclease NurA [Candidatus Aenigmarchaeota archaeon]